MGDQNVNNSLLEGGCHVGDIYGDALHAAGVEVIENCRFHAAEAEIIAGAGNLAAGKNDGMGVAFARRLVDLGSAWVAQADLTGNLVKSLAGRVVLGPSQDLVLSVISDQHQMGVASRNNQTGKGRLQGRLGNIVGTDVSLYMMDSDQRDPCRKAQSLGGRDADEQGAHQTGTVGHGDGIHFLQLSAGLLQGLADDLRHALGVLSGGDLGHHAAVERVDVDLGGDHVGEDLPAVHNDRSRRLITAGFNCQNGYIFFQITHILKSCGPSEQTGHIYYTLYKNFSEQQKTQAGHESLLPGHCSLIIAAGSLLPDHCFRITAAGSSLHRPRQRTCTLRPLIIFESQGDGLAVFAGITVREYLSDRRHKVVRLDQGRTVMCQPHLLRRSLPCNARRLGKGHVLFLTCLGRVFRLTVHALADQKIRVLRIFDNAFAGTCVGAVDQFQALAGRPQDHVRCQDGTVFGLDCLALLQTAPEFHGNLLRFRAFGVKTSLAVKRKGVSVTGHIVVDPEGVDMEILFSGQSDLLFPLRQFQELNFKRNLRGDHTQAVHDTGKSLGSYHQDRLCAFRVSHGQQHSGQAGYVVRMEMREQHHVDRLGAPPPPSERDLGSFSAVHQYSFSVVSDHQGCEIPIRKRHHSPCSEQTDINHKFFTLSDLPLSRAAA